MLSVVVFISPGQFHGIDFACVDRFIDERPKSLQAYV